MKLTEALRGDYAKLWKSCQVKSEKAEAVTEIIQKILAHQADCKQVANQTGVPWPVIGVMQAMEASANFTRHLHNGDPLTARTVQVPKGRPKKGNPPFTWPESAADALTFDGFAKWTDWSIAGTLFKLEGYNGWGYRMHHPEVLSPYLWSFSNHYSKGKYVADGTWSGTAVSAQCGAAVLLRRLAELGHVSFADATPPDPAVAGPLLRYSPNAIQPHAAELQEFLNTIPGIHLKVDGFLGDRSSDAFRLLSGRYLLGDPRD